MSTFSIKPIEPDERTHVLVGDEGVVWIRAAGRAPMILAARSAAQRERVAWSLDVCFDDGYVPNGVSRAQRASVALLDGSVVRGCQWFRWDEAEAPDGLPADTLHPMG